MLDFSHNGYEALFRGSLANGVNLFCGAGFSVYANDEHGRAMPVGTGLLEELKERFGSIREYDSLTWACTKLLNSDKQPFHSFLRQRFTVSGFDHRYAVLTMLPIRNIYTTNIDDLIPKVYARDGCPVELVDRSLVGAEYVGSSSGGLVGYHPLHGSVTHPSEDYVFGAEEVASAFSLGGDTSYSWRALERDASAPHALLGLELR